MIHSSLSFRTFRQHATWCATVQGEIDCSCHEFALVPLEFPREGCRDEPKRQFNHVNAAPHENRISCLRHPGTVIAPECRCFELSSPADPLLLLSGYCRLAFRSRFDESSYSLRLRHIDGVASRKLDNSCSCACGHSPLRVRWNHLVFSG